MPPETSRSDSFRARISLKGRSLRQHTARGALINAAFMAGLTSLGFLKGFILAAFISRAEYGVWGILVISLGTLLWLKQVGIGDKYIQQDDENQEHAFQKAFTLELIFTLGFCVLLLAALPVIAIVYDRPEIIAPGLVVVAILPAGILQTPLWVYYRRMEFLRQRTLQAVDPVVGFVVTIGLAIAGFGYWSLVIGLLVGAWTAAAVAVFHSPFKLRLRYDRGSLRSYADFSWPLFVASGASMVLVQAGYIAAEAELGIAAVGAVILASSVSQFTDRLDGIVTGALYPALCAVRERTDLLYESFVKSNRLALMWAVPFGLGLALFSPDLVTFGIGEEWRPAVILLQIFGVTAAFGHIGFNWDAYFRARGDTKPMAVASVASMVTFLALGLPLLWAYGLAGYGAGVAAQGLAHLIVRGYYLGRLFNGFAFVGHAARAIAPSVLPVALILLLREVEPTDRTLLIAVSELSLYLAVTALVTYLMEGPLLREAMGYLRSRVTETPATPVAAP